MLSGWLGLGSAVWLPMFVSGRWFPRVPGDSPKSLSKSDNMQHVNSKWIQVSTTDVNVTALSTCVQRRTYKDLAVSLPWLTARRSLTGNHAGQ